MCLNLSRAGAESAVKGNAVQPVAEIPLRNAATNHALKIHNQVKRHSVQKIGINQHHRGCKNGRRRLVCHRELKKEVCKIGIKE